MKWFLSFNPDRALGLLFLLLLISVPFGTKKFIYSFGPQVDEFTSIFLYASDILLVLFLVIFFVNIRTSDLLTLKRQFWEVGYPKIIFGSLLAFLFFAGFSIFLASYKVLAVYQLVRLILLILMAIAVADLLKRGLVRFHHIAMVIAASSVFQAIVAIFQFKFFRSLGLWFLGEPVVGVFTQNVARFRIDDLTFLRGFGTLPHANILAAFLVLGLLCFYYLWLKKDTSMLSYIGIAVGIFIVSLSLVFTFSRSGWIVAGIVTLFVILWGLLNKDFRKQTVSLVVILFTIFYLLFSNFNWLVLPRAQFPAGDVSVSHRMIYNQIGLEIIKENPFGVGIGNQLFFGIENELYQKQGLIKLTSWQPIHNIYLLIASEIGILGLLAFLVFVFQLLIKNCKFRGLELTTSYLLLTTFLLFGLVDHFPWTLQSGRLMLWLAIGLVLGVGLRNNELKSS